jgi:hypothetical protein
MTADSGQRKDPHSRLMHHVESPGDLHSSVRRAYRLPSIGADGQQMQSDASVDAAARVVVIESLATRIESGYVVPEVGQLAARELRKAAVGGAYDTYTTARAFAGPMPVLVIDHVEQKPTDN